MKVTSAIPIISAAAVAAVRPGLRWAFRSASLPAAPPMRRAGMPTTRASGRTSRDESIATPTNSASTPTPSKAKRSPRRGRRRASRSRARGRRAPTIAPAMYGVKRAKRPRGIVAPSRTAAIGGTLVARIAGKRPATSVTSVPTSSETTIVRVAKTVSVCGSSRLSALKSSFRPTASPRPLNEPDDRRAEADHERLEDHRPEHLAPRRAERAQGRELPHPLRDRDRERVEDDERADEERDAGEREQEVADDRREGGDLARLLVRLLDARADRDVVAELRLDPLRQLLGRGALGGGGLHGVELAFLVQQRLRGRAGRRSRTSRCRAS